MYADSRGKYGYYTQLNTHTCLNGIFDAKNLQYSDTPKEEFKPIHAGEVGMYVCGITFTISVISVTGVPLLLLTWLALSAFPRL